MCTAFLNSMTLRTLGLEDFCSFLFAHGDIIFGPAREVLLYFRIDLLSQLYEWCKPCTVSHVDLVPHSLSSPTDPNADQKIHIIIICCYIYSLPLVKLRHSCPVVSFSIFV